MARVRQTAPAEVLDPEREAIQREAREAETRLATEKAIQEKMNAAIDATKARLVVSEGVQPPPPILAEAQNALGAGFFGGVSSAAILPTIASAPPPPPAVVATTQTVPLGKLPLSTPMCVESSSSAEEATWTHGEELYGKQGTFSQYRVGPFTGKTKVRPGETHGDALDRLKRELRAQADEERVAAHERFMAHWKKNIAGT